MKFFEKPKTKLGLSAILSTFVLINQIVQLGESLTTAEICAR